MTLLLAADPGPTKTALVLACPMPGLRIAVVRAEMVPSTFTGFDTFLAQCHEMPSVVAIEVAEGYVHDAYRAPGLLRQNYEAGKLHAIATMRGAKVVDIAADKWRKAVIGSLKKGQKYDEVIARLLPLVVSGLDKGNVHVRDAAGVAVWASRMVWGRRVA